MGGEANKCKERLNIMQPVTTVQDQIMWHPPDIGAYKLNVDASLHIGECMFTLGLVVRDDRGQFIRGNNMRLAGEVSVMEAEATDSQLVVHALDTENVYQLEVGHIIDDCKEKLNERADLSVLHVKKQANKAAHLMARVPCLLNNYNYFISPPDLLFEMLTSEFPT
ncbi:uncharacterized protein LOC141704788 [Apium graveolens]|uniref:uncharacterized protein LOC141704788 n=1 Tax=Apium graveolens TaxID=4045 RepID=UPI003D79EAE4